MTIFNGHLLAHEARIVMDTGRTTIGGSPLPEERKTLEVPRCRAVVFGRGNEAIVKAAADLAADVPTFDDLADSLPDICEEAYDRVLQEMAADIRERGLNESVKMGHWDYHHYFQSLTVEDIKEMLAEDVEDKPEVAFSLRHEVFAAGYSERERSMVILGVVSYWEAPVRLRPQYVFGSNPEVICREVTRLGRFTVPDQLAVLRAQYASQLAREPEPGGEDLPDGGGCGGDVTLTTVTAAGEITHRTLGPLVQEPRKAGKKVGRNEPCPCGSGRKHKKCCLNAEAA